jgi:hypothetical protein
MAAQNGQHNAVQILLENGAKPDAAKKVICDYFDVELRLVVNFEFVFGI